MKIKQITSLILMLTMLVLSTSCGKSPSVNSNLPTPKSQAANLNQDLVPKETWGEWGKRNLLWIGTTLLCVSYMGLTEYRRYSDRKAMEKRERAVDAQLLKIDDNKQKIDDNKNEADNKIGQVASDLVSTNSKAEQALNSAYTATNWVARIDNKLDEYKKEVDAYRCVPQSLPKDSLPKGDHRGGHSIPLPKGGQLDGKKKPLPPAHGGPQRKVDAKVDDNAAKTNELK